MEVSTQPPPENGKNTNSEGAAFHRMLAWLDPDPEQASRRFLEIEQKLEKTFACRGCPCPEELKDETVQRVIRIIRNPEKNLLENWVGDPIAQFYAVSHFVYLEYLRKPKNPRRPFPDPKEPVRSEEEYACLEQCMQELPPKERQLIAEYYQEDKHAKIEFRKKLARRRGMELNALRIQACRIRKKLRKCISRCLNPDQEI